MRAQIVAAAVLLTAAFTLPATAAPERATAAGQLACSEGDRPETGVSGQVPITDQLSGRSREGYTCNVRRVGTNNLNGLGGDTQMTWLGQCAYYSVSDGNAVAVLDVRTPTKPRLVKILREPEWSGLGGTLGIHEGLTANESRKLLIVPLGTTLTTYDVSSCTQPRRLSFYDFGLPPDPIKNLPRFDDGIHSGKLSPDGTLYYATDIGNGAVSLTGPCLTIVDLRNVREPKLVTRWAPDFPCHDLSLSADGKRAYVGYYDATIGHPSAVVGAFAPGSPLSHATSGLRIVDTSQVQQHRANPQLTILSTLTGGRQHTETLAKIKGRTYIIGGEEGFCPGGNGRIVDITDERHPVVVAEVPLGVNQLENCALARADLGAELLLYMSHYISVDDPNDASLAFFTWYGSGLRVFNIRDPKHPVEVGYYNPPVGQSASDRHDSSTTYSRYDAKSGQVWFGAGVTGLNVVELAPSIRPKAKNARWSVGPLPPLPTSFSTARTTDRSLLLEQSLRWFCTARLQS